MEADSKSTTQASKNPAAQAATAAEADADAAETVHVVLIDHDDSFTHILAHYLGLASGKMPSVLNHEEATIEKIRSLKPTYLVLSPGPGHPDEYPVDQEIMKAFAGKLPILGVCLGHQSIARFFGAQVRRAPRPMHGKTSRIQHKQFGEFKAMRYHSLMVSDLPEELEVTAQAEDGTIMAFSHRSLPIQGLQFHPESVGTEKGLELIKNALQKNSQLSSTELM